MSRNTNAKKPWHPTSRRAKGQIKRIKKDNEVQDYVELEAVVSDRRMSWMVFESDGS